MKTKNIQDVVVERVEEFRETFLVPTGEDNWTPENYPHPLGITNWLTTTLTQYHQDLMSEVRAGIKKELTEQELLNDGSDVYIKLADALWVCDSEKERDKFTNTLTEAQTIIKSLSK